MILLAAGEDLAGTRDCGYPTRQDAGASCLSPQEP